MKTFKIGNERSLKLNKKNDSIFIEDKTLRRRLTPFLQCLDQIDNQLRRLSEGEDVAYCMHYAGTWHVSLTKGFRCVALRKFFVPTDQTVWKPTKTGIALRLNKWPTFKQAIDKLHRDNPTATTYTPCLLNLDHITPEIIATCPERNLSFNHRVTVYPADDYDRKSP